VDFGPQNRPKDSSEFYISGHVVDFGPRTQITGGGPEVLVPKKSQLPTLGNRKTASSLDPPDPMNHLKIFKGQPRQDPSFKLVQNISE